MRRSPKAQGASQQRVGLRGRARRRSAAGWARPATESPGRAAEPVRGAQDHVPAGPQGRLQRADDAIHRVVVEVDQEVAAGDQVERDLARRRRRIVDQVVAAESHQRPSLSPARSGRPRRRSDACAAPPAGVAPSAPSIARPRPAQEPRGEMSVPSTATGGAAGAERLAGEDRERVGLLARGARRDPDAYRPEPPAAAPSASSVPRHRLKLAQLAKEVGLLAPSPRRSGGPSTPLRRRIPRPRKGSGRRPCRGPPWPGPPRSRSAGPL